MKQKREGLALCEETAQNIVMRVKFNLQEHGRVPKEVVEKLRMSAHIDDRQHRLAGFYLIRDREGQASRPWRGTKLRQP